MEKSKATGLIIIAFCLGTAFGFAVKPSVKEVMVQTTTLIETKVVTSSSQPASTPKVLVRYYGFVYTTFGDCKPSAGYVYLIVRISVQNLGYESVPTASASFGNPYPYYFYLAVGGQQFNGFPLRCMKSEEVLPMTNVVNGLTVSGFLTFETPANFGSFTLIYHPPSGNYNIQYINEGYRTATSV